MDRLAISTLSAWVNGRSIVSTAMRSASCRESPGDGVTKVLGHRVSPRVLMLAVDLGAMMRSLTQPRLTGKLIERALRELPPPGARRNAINALMSQRGANTLMQPITAGSPLRQP